MIEARGRSAARQRHFQEQGAAAAEEVAQLPADEEQAVNEAAKKKDETDSNKHKRDEKADDMNRAGEKLHVRAEIEAARNVDDETALTAPPQPAQSDDSVAVITAEDFTKMPKDHMKNLLSAAVKKLDFSGYIKHHSS